MDHQSPPIVKTKRMHVLSLLATILSHLEDERNGHCRDHYSETHVVGENTTLPATRHTRAASRVKEEEWIPSIITSRRRRRYWWGSHYDGRVGLKDGASLDTIHNTIKMMASGSETKYNQTPQQLMSAFLQRLRRKEKLECGPDGKKHKWGYSTVIGSLKNPVARLSVCLSDRFSSRDNTTQT